jgi:predicted DNA-binding transcriptional regulator AlpA
MSRTTVSGVPDLMSAAEIAAMLGISRQRVDQIAKADTSFPEPRAVLRGIRVWDTEAVERWAREAGRIE